VVENCDEFSHAEAVDVSDTCHVEDDPLRAGTNSADIFTQCVGSRFLLAPSFRTIAERPHINAIIMCVQEE
jgi:hypothetical protein